jgi:RNA polymerase sigma factor (sigma-70 family)
MGVPPPDASPVPPADEVRIALVRKLFEDHNRALVTFLAARLHSHTEARDVAQEAYVRMLQLEEPGAVGFLRAYLFRIASNLAVDRLRRRNVREEGPPQALFEELLSRPGPERAVLAHQELEIVKAALRELPEKCRQAFALYMFNEQSIPDIAALMGVSQRMIRQHIAEALAYCRVKRDRGNREDQGGRR